MLLNVATGRFTGLPEGLLCLESSCCAAVALLAHKSTSNFLPHYHMHSYPLYLDLGLSRHAYTKRHGFIHAPTHTSTISLEAESTCYSVLFLVTVCLGTPNSFSAETYSLNGSLNPNRLRPDCHDTCFAVITRIVHLHGALSAASGVLPVLLGSGYCVSRL
jgi:hypothetical protein